MRSKILPVSRLTRLTEKEKKEAIPYPEDSPTPSQMTPDDCCYPDAPRPCPLVSCKFNNYLSTTEIGTIMLTWPDLQPEEVPPELSCLNDMIKRGKYGPENPMPFREIGEFFGTTRQGAKDMVENAQQQARLARRWNLKDKEEE